MTIVAIAIVLLLISVWTLVVLLSRANARIKALEEPKDEVLCDEAIPVLERKYHELNAEVQRLREDRDAAIERIRKRKEEQDV